jgi:hypothetical protein
MEIPRQRPWAAIEGGPWLTSKRLIFLELTERDLDRRLRDPQRGI